MGVGCSLTPTRAVAKQVPIAYDINVVPTPIPVTTPVADTVPIAVLALLHTPPDVASDNGNVNVWHISPAPIIGTGCGFTVTTRETEQVSVPQIMVDVPLLKPVTVPSVPTVATLPLLLVQPTPVVASVSEIDDPAHILAEPPPVTVIAAG